MRIRFSFAVAFLVLLFLASSAGLLPHSSLPEVPAAAQPYVPTHAGKALHFLCFFALTGIFYFILDAPRKRVLHLTLVVCTLLLGVGSEVAQGLLPNDREFDPWDVLVNVLGSLAAVGLANAYHRRAAERRRRAKYAAITGDALDEDLELGETSSGVQGDELGRTGISTVLDNGQETGVISVTPQPIKKSVEDEIDNWDENAEDDVWDDEDDDVAGVGAKRTPTTSSAGSEDVPKKLAVD